MCSICTFNFGAFLPLDVAVRRMPKEDKKRSAVGNDAAKTTPYKKMTPSASPTPPSSSGAEQRAREEYRARHAVLKARIESEQEEVQAGLQKLQQLKPTAAEDDADDAIARDLPA